MASLLALLGVASLLVGRAIVGQELANMPPTSLADVPASLTAEVLEPRSKWGFPTALVEYTPVPGVSQRMNVDGLPKPEKVEVFLAQNRRIGDEIDIAVNPSGEAAEAGAPLALVQARLARIMHAATALGIALLASAFLVAWLAATRSGTPLEHAPTAQRHGGA